MKKWNVDKSIEVLKNEATNESRHQCAKSVRIAVEAGGLDTTGRPNAAYQYISFLPKIGFEKVAELTGKTEQKEFQALPGDIAVMKHGDYGHICMWSGSQWISDFKQRGMWPYSGEGTCEIFRFKEEI